MDKKKRVLVGMSGGIDSSAACLMLQEQGYEPVGLTMRVWDLPRQFSTPGQELPNFIEEAKTLAARLGMEHVVADEREAFRGSVVRNFCDEYLQGRTPNPCVMCNPLFKFRVLTEWADRLGCAHIATGHYVRLMREAETNKYYVEKGDDTLKDQSYFLWRVGQDVLARCIFPLGKLTKTEVRQYLAAKGFAAKAKEGESMEVCFVEGDYRDFLRQQIPDLDQRIGGGKFVDAEGHTLGTHKGFAYYTVGQRRGLGIALGEPAFVLKLNPQKNTVMLGKQDDLLADRMLLENFSIVDETAFFSARNLTVKIRYRSRPIACTVRRVKDLLTENGAPLLLVHFAQPASAITPGQSAVFYQDNRVVAGAYIASQRGLSLYDEHS